MTAHRSTVALVGVAALVALAGRPALDRVRAGSLDDVTVGEVVLDCSDGASAVAVTPEGLSSTVPRLDIGEDGRCQGRVEVTNPGRFDLRIVRVSFADAGLEGEGPLLVDGLTAGGARFVTVEEPGDEPHDPADATFEVTQPLPAGESRTLVFSVRRARSRCAALPPDAVGTSLAPGRFPAVRVEAGGRRAAAVAGPGGATVEVVARPC
ncbi:MAG: hypothetical protein ACLGIR_00905 [Actinomycetes bacterium]